MDPVVEDAVWVLTVNESIGTDNVPGLYTIEISLLVRSLRTFLGDGVLISPSSKSERSSGIGLGRSKFLS